MSPQKPALLVVEDEPSIRDGLCDVLAYHGYAPEGVARGDEGLAQGLRNRHALVMLDVMLPGLDGFAVCRRLREQLPRLPILMLTARGAEQDVLEGFRAGADDYVTKPFAVSELLARVGALLRRCGVPTRAASPAPFALAGWSIEPAAGVALRDGCRVELTPKELALLALFAEEPGRILSRRRLLQEVWGFPDPDRVETRTVDMHVANLRRKLCADGDPLIETVRGEGYRLVG